MLYMIIFGSILELFWYIFGAPVDSWKSSSRVRGSSIQRGAEGQEFDIFRCLFRDLPQSVPNGIPEEPFAELVGKKCPQVMPDGYHNPANIAAARRLILVYIY